MCHENPGTGAIDLDLGKISMRREKNRGQAQTSNSQFSEGAVCLLGRSNMTLKGRGKLSPAHLGCIVKSVMVYNNDGTLAEDVYPHTAVPPRFPTLFHWTDNMKFHLLTFAANNRIQRKNEIREIAIRICETYKPYGQLAVDHFEMKLSWPSFIR